MGAREQIQTNDERERRLPGQFGSGARIEVTLSPRHVLRILLLITLVLVAISFTADFLMRFQWADVTFRGRDRLFLVLEKFIVDDEETVPTAFTVGLLFASSALLAVIAHSDNPAVALQRRRWWLLAGIMLALAIDETAALHDLATNVLHDALNASGALYFTWVLPAGLFVVAVGLYYRRLVMHLPARIRNLVLAGGLIYVAGAWGGDILSGIFFEARDIHPLLFPTIWTIEELCEMGGLAVFIYALLRYQEYLGNPAPQPEPMTVSASLRAGNGSGRRNQRI